MELIYDHNLNESLMQWRGIVKQIHNLTQKDFDKLCKDGVSIAPYNDYIEVELSYCSRQGAIGVNGRSVAICDKPVNNLYHISKFTYGFFTHKKHELNIDDELIFVPHVNVYKPNIILPTMKSFYKLS
jgi:hypothetical protein